MRASKLKTFFFSCIAQFSLGTKASLRANHFTWLSKKCIVGKNCHFNGMKITGNGKVLIGDNFHSGEDCLIITSNHNYDEGKSLPYDTTNIDKEVVIGKNVWIGSRVIILPGATLGDGCIVQAGSVVSGHIQSLQIVGGNPAKCFKKRNENHYFELEHAKKYL